MKGTNIFGKLLGSCRIQYMLVGCRRIFWLKLSVFAKFFLLVGQRQKIL